MRRAKTFEDLEAWRVARVLAGELYQLTSRGAVARDFVLRDQVRACGVSIMANVAEGFERDGNREFVQFLSQAKGSCGELRSHLWLLRDLALISEEDFWSVAGRATELSRILFGLMKYLRSSPIRGRKFGDPADPALRVRREAPNPEGLPRPIR